MKTNLMPKKLLALLMAFTITLTLSCGDDDTPPEEVPNLVNLAVAQPNLSSLVSALNRFPDLAQDLSGTAEFTILAPTNDAFAAILNAVGQDDIRNVPDNVLRGILEYHVIPGTVRSTDLQNGNVTTVGGEAITVDITNGVRFNTTAGVVTANVAADNGIVHIIDEVLVQPSVQPIVGTVVAPAYFNNQFTTLIAAVQAASPSILTTLLNSDNKTLFAPTNDAFTAAGITSLPDQATLDAVLTYHVIGSTVNAEDIADGSSSAPTLNGNIYLSKGANGVFINGKTEVTTTNIAASNGVVHVIDRTLLPPSETIADIAVAASTAQQQPEFTQLVAALQKVPDLLNAADSDGNLTVYAPTDAAFQSLYIALNVADLDALEALIGNDKLAEVLQHHIVGARVFSTDKADGTITTLNQDITVDLTNLTIADASGSDPAGLVVANLDILATNGVIHTIDRVLIPNGIL